MGMCPKCQSLMKIIGTRMVCECGYQYEIPVRLPSYTELLKENKELRQRVEELEQAITRLTERRTRVP